MSFENVNETTENEVSGTNPMQPGAAPQSDGGEAIHNSSADLHTAGVEEEMTVHGALRELKVLPKRINAAIGKIRISSGVTESEVKSTEVQRVLTDGKAALVQALDLIRRYDTIKSALVLSNAVTTDTTSSLTKAAYGSTPSVAQIIEKRGFYLQALQQVLNAVLSNIESSTTTAERITAAANTAALKLVSGDGRATTPDTLPPASMEVYNNYLNLNRGTVAWAPGINKDLLISSLTDEINLIETKYDEKLSVANAIATVQITYPVGRTIL